MTWGGKQSRTRRLLLRATVPATNACACFYGLRLHALEEYEQSYCAHKSGSLSAGTNKRPRDFQNPGRRKLMALAMCGVCQGFETFMLEGLPKLSTKPWADPLEAPERFALAPPAEFELCVRLWVDLLRRPMLYRRTVRTGQ